MTTRTNPLQRPVAHHRTLVRRDARADPSTLTQRRRTVSREGTTLGLKVTSVDGPTQATVAATRPLLVSADEAAHLLSIGRTTLYRLAREGELRPVHIGRCVRFLVGELEDFVKAKHAHLPPPAEPD